MLFYICCYKIQEILKIIHYKALFSSFKITLRLIIILPDVLLGIVNLSKDFYYFIITNMTLANWLLAAAGIWGLALTWMWAFAAQNTQPSTEDFKQNRPQMMREFWSGDMKEFKWPEFKLENITANLSESDKEAVEKLLTQYREEEKTFHEAVEKATASIREEFENSKTSIKEKIISITWESEEVERLFNRWGWRGHWRGMGMWPKMDGERSELPEMNGERPEFPGHRGNMNQASQTEQQAE